MLSALKTTNATGLGRTVPNFENCPPNQATFQSSRRDFIKIAALAGSLPLLMPTAFASIFSDERTAWYRNAKFGMFIHWGPYSLASVEASWPIMTPTPGALARRSIASCHGGLIHQSSMQITSLIWLRPPDSNTWCSRRNTTTVFACSTLPTQTTRLRILPTEGTSSGNWRMPVVEGTCQLGFTTHHPTCTTRLFVTPRNWRKKIGTGSPHVLTGQCSSSICGCS